jgi:hypothetical protein
MATITVYPGNAGMEKGLAEINRLLLETMSLARTFQPPKMAMDLSELEKVRVAEGRYIADLLIAEDIISAHLNIELRTGACSEARERMRATGALGVEDGGWQPVHVRLPGGTDLHLYTRYLRPSHKGKRGRRRGIGKRGPTGVGCYPVLERLGIHDGVTPLTRFEIARMVVLCSSLEEARVQLARGGLVLHTSTLVLVAVGTGEVALEHRDQAIENARKASLPVVSLVAGMRLRISVDGGRARTRQTRRGRGIRPGENGRRPFDLAWREPRVITIDVLDPEGDMDRSWKPIYEVTMGDADQTFALLVGILRLIGAYQASSVEFVSDGAEWIWRRATQALVDAGVPSERTRLVLDYYHATEYISEALELCKGLTAKERKTTFHELCGLLLEEGGPGKVVSRLRALARGRRAKKVNKKADYLDQHIAHMRYFELRKEKLPIGSGIVESAVRRIINMRFKSASMCWRVDHLLPLLCLRAVLKAGRWDSLVNAWLNGRHWLEPGAPITTGQPEAAREAA